LIDDTISISNDIVYGCRPPAVSFPWSGKKQRDLNRLNSTDRSWTVKNPKLATLKHGILFHRPERYCSNGGNTIKNIPQPWDYRQCSLSEGKTVERVLVTRYPRDFTRCLASFAGALATRKAAEAEVKAKEARHRPRSAASERKRPTHV